MMRSIAWAYDMTLWVVVGALVLYGAWLAIPVVRKWIRRNMGSLRGSHASQFQDGIPRRR